MNSQCDILDYFCCVERRILRSLAQLDSVKDLTA